MEPRPTEQSHTVFRALGVVAVIGAALLLAAAVLCALDRRAPGPMGPALLALGLLVVAVVLFGVGGVARAGGQAARRSREQTRSLRELADAGRTIMQQSVRQHPPPVTEPARCPECGTRAVQDRGQQIICPKCGKTVTLA